jgi:hypothetical protein
MSEAIRLVPGGLDVPDHLGPAAQVLPEAVGGWRRLPSFS